MTKKALTQAKEWEQKRSRLFEYVSKAQKKDKLAAAIHSVMTDESSTKGRVTKEKAQKYFTYTKPTVTGFKKLGLDDADIHSLLASFPGNWLDSLSYSNKQAPNPQAQNGSNKAFVITPPTEGLVQIQIYNPGDLFNCSDILCSGCLQAYGTSQFPGKLSQKTIDSISSALEAIESHEFHVCHKDSLDKPNRTKSQRNSEAEAALWASIIQTAYEAPFYDDQQDWRSAAQKALMGMQYLGEKESESLVEALSLYFSELDDTVNMNQLIRKYQEQVKNIQQKTLTHNVAEIFSAIHDRGLQNFFNGWIKQLDESVKSPAAHISRRHTPSLRVGMAINEAEELGSNLTASLRIHSVSPQEKRTIVNDLKTSIRKFNSIWNDLDKKEQKVLRPKVLQIIHQAY